MSPEMSKTCNLCGKTYKNIRSHRNKCKSPKKPGLNSAGQEEVSSSAQDGKDVLGFHVVRRPRSSRDAMKDAMEEMEAMDGAEGLVLLQELRGNDTYSDDEQGVDYSGIESVADNQVEVLMACSDKRTSAVECNSHPVVDTEGRLSRSDAIDNSGVVQKDNYQKLAESFEFGERILLINILSLKPKRNSASADLDGGTKKCANEALLVKEPKLTRNDDGQGPVDCPENSAVMELKRPKLDLKVSDKSENIASDDAQGVINDASGKQTSLTEPMAREADQEPGQKVGALEDLKEQAAKGATSVDELETDNPGEESGADNTNVVLTSCSDKSSCSAECYGVGDSTSDLKEAASAPLKLKYYTRASSAYPCRGTKKSGNEAPVVEEVDLSCKHSRQELADCPEKSAAIELRKPKLDPKVLDNSPVMQEEKQKVDLSAPAPSDSSEEERSDIIDGESNQTA